MDSNTTQTKGHVMKRLTLILIALALASCAARPAPSAASSQCMTDLECAEQCKYDSAFTGDCVY